MEHRHHRQDDVARGNPHRVGHRGDHAVQHVGAVAVDDALGVARCARGVAHAGRGILVERLPAIAAAGLLKPFLVGDDVGQRRLGHVRPVGQHDHLPQRLHRRRDLLDQRHEGQVDEDRPVLGMVHDPGDLVGKEPRVQRVVDAAHAHDAVPGLDMARRVPGQRGDAVAGGKPVALQPLGNLQRALARLPVGGAHDRALDRARDDLAVRMLSGRVVENLVAEQRPFLHQSEHCVPPQNSLSAHSGVIAGFVQLSVTFPSASPRRHNAAILAVNGHSRRGALHKAEG